MAKTDVNWSYRERRSDIDALLRLIGQEVHRHAQDALAEGPLWTHLGDLVHVRVCLLDLLAFLMNEDRPAAEQRLAVHKRKESRDAAQRRD